ncbi:uncharacterized protein LOC100368511 [Saccoglossus kowalevskii]
MYIAVDPAANELLKFKDLVKTKAEEWYNVIFDFQDITIEQYLEVNGTRQFGMIVASHSVYYWNNLETTTMELYSSLLKGGMMFFKITGGGWEKLCAKVGKYYLDPDCNFIGVHTIEDIFKRNRPNVNYQTERRELWVDHFVVPYERVTLCYHNATEQHVPHKRVWDIMPYSSEMSLVAIHSFQQQQGQQKTKSAIIALLLRRSRTDYSALYTVPCLAQGISAFVVGPHHKTVITLDLDYMREH